MKKYIYDKMKDTVTSQFMWQIHWKMLKIEGDNFPFGKTPEFTDILCR